MQTFAMIDNNSGFLFGVVAAETPEDACRVLDESVGCHGRTYERVRISGTTQTGYVVYNVTGTMEAGDDLDGQDEATIDRASTGRLVAEIACRDAA